MYVDMFGSMTIKYTLSNPMILSSTASYGKKVGQGLPILISTGQVVYY